MLLEDDSLLLGHEESSHPLPRLEVAPEPVQTAPEPEVPQDTYFRLVFETAGPLGIEFKEHHHPYLVAEVHQGLATGRGLLSGDELVQVGDKVVGAMPWSEFVQLLGQRPVEVTFRRRPPKEQEGGAAGGALLSGFTNSMRLFGGVAQQGLELGSKGFAGLDLGGRVGSVTSSLVTGLAEVAKAAPLQMLSSEEAEQAKPQPAVQVAKAEEEEPLHPPPPLAQSFTGEGWTDLLNDEELPTAHAVASSRPAETRPEPLPSLTQAPEVVQLSDPDLHTFVTVQNGGSGPHAAPESAAEKEKSDSASERLIAQLQEEVLRLQQEKAEMEEAVPAAVQAQLAQQARADAAEAAAARLHAEVEDLRRSLSQVQQGQDERWRQQVAALQAERETQQAEALQLRTQLCTLEAQRQVQQQRCEELLAAHSGEQQQFQSSLAEKDRLLAEKVELLMKKDQEVKSLLKQLAVVPAVSNAAAGSPASQSDASAGPASPPAPSIYEVTFIQQGSLGIEFIEMEPPYIVQEVTAGSVAETLGISVGDEFIVVDSVSVTSMPWDEVKKMLVKRPVNARLQRPLPKAAGPLAGALLSSVSSVGNSILSVARGASNPNVTEQQKQHFERLQAEAERLSTLLRARDEEVQELGSRLEQSDEALRMLQAGDEGRASAAQLVQEREAQAQRAARLESKLEEVQKQSAALQAECLQLRERCREEQKEKEEWKHEASASQARCNSVMTQFDSLQATCTSLSQDSQQKSGLEGQVQELLRMNAQWQQAHQILMAETDGLRQRATESHRLEAEVVQLRQYEQAVQELQARLVDTEGQLDFRTAELELLQRERKECSVTIERLESLVESLQESGESQAGQMEAELLERSREASTLRREVEDQRRRNEDLVKRQEAASRAAEEAKALAAERDALQAALQSAQQEQAQLRGVLDRCLQRMEKEGQERPHLVDKRMVTQMVAAYLEQRDHPKQQQEIMSRMADLLGFTTQEREQVGLASKRKSLMEHQDEPEDLEDFAKLFVNFLEKETDMA